MGADAAMTHDCPVCGKTHAPPKQRSTYAVRRCPVCRKGVRYVGGHFRARHPLFVPAVIDGRLWYDFKRES